MVSPVRDGLATVNNWTATLTKTITLTTALTNDVICVAWASDITTGGGANTATITGITSTHGLVFTRVARSTAGPTGTAQGVASELWTAPSAAALTAEVLTVTLDKAPDDCCLVVFGVNGVNSIASPFDTNVSLPVTGSSITTTPPTLTYSTTQANDLLLYIHANGSGNVPQGPAGWTTIAAITNFGGGLFSSLVVSSLSVSAIQTGATATSTNTGINGWFAALLTAFTADAAGPPASQKNFTRAHQLAYLRN